MKIGEWVLYNDKKYRVVKLLAGRLIIQPAYATVKGDCLTVARCEVTPLDESARLKFNDIREVK